MKTLYIVRYCEAKFDNIDNLYSGYAMENDTDYRELYVSEDYREALYEFMNNQVTAENNILTEYELEKIILDENDNLVKRNIIDKKYF